MEKIVTLHPEGKAGANIDKAKYQLIRQTITQVIRDHGVITFKKLVSQVEQRLAGPFQGSIPWYVTTVKLDMEARGIIERLPKSRPQQIQLVSTQSQGLESD